MMAEGRLVAEGKAGEYLSIPGTTLATPMSCPAARSTRITLGRNGSTRFFNSPFDRNPVSA
jgi:hypothetical protein